MQAKVSQDTTKSNANICAENVLYIGYQIVKFITRFKCRKAWEITVNYAIVAPIYHPTKFVRLLLRNIRNLYRNLTTVA